MNTIHEKLAELGLVRTREGRVLAGVCSGLAATTGANPWVMRLLVLLLMVVLPGSPLLLYPIAWILMPQEGDRPAVTASAPPEPQDEIRR